MSIRLIGSPTISFRLDYDTVRQLSDIADYLEKPVSSLVRAAVEQYVSEYEESESYQADRKAGKRFRDSYVKPTQAEARAEVEKYLAGFENDSLQ